MPDINMQVFEEIQRNQLVTEVDIQTQVALDDYQVHLSDIANPTQSQDNVVIDRFGEFLPHWNESLNFDTWIKMSMGIAGKRILMLRGNSNVSSVSSGDNVFVQWHGPASAVFLDSLIVTAPVIYEAKVRKTSSSSNIKWGLANVDDRTDDEMLITTGTDATNLRYIIAGNEGTESFKSEAPTLATNIWYKARMVNDNTKLQGYYDDNEVSTGVTTNLPNENMGLIMMILSGTGEQEYSFARKHTATEPTTWAADGEQNIIVALKSLGRAG